MSLTAASRPTTSVHPAAHPGTPVSALLDVDVVDAWSAPRTSSAAALTFCLHTGVLEDVVR
ncbi:hypothetical protein [Kineococcus sp. NPDC059986]|jgi:hypothetical protein|uniref:hypothetical protein n=1 Tax=Kineococcus sp. NPDC059986 TaxID=3155538 RepID=UPI00344DA7F2